MMILIVLPDIGNISVFLIVCPWISGILLLLERIDISRLSRILLCGSSLLISRSKNDKRGMRQLPYYISTKLDGTSCSIGVDENGFHVTGHNYEYKDDGSSGFYKLVNERGYKDSLEAFVKQNGLKTLTIQGEYCGPGILKNRLKLVKPEWYVFTIRENGKRVGLDRMLEICRMLGLDHVPIEERGMDLPAKYPTVEALLERADGDYPRGGKKEGIVIRPTEPVFCPLISASLSMKVVSNKYLLKNEG